MPLEAPEALVLQLLAWVAERPRTYADAMDAWRTSCPRLPVWEDAVDAGLIDLGPSCSEMGSQRVQLTLLGREFLTER